MKAQLWRQPRAWLSTATGNPIQGEGVLRTVRKSTTSTPVSPPVFLLTIGVDNYSQQDGGEHRALKGCVNDANDFQSFLKTIYPLATIFGLRNEEATFEGVTSALLSLAGSEVKRGSTIIIYYAGHGCVALPPVDYPGVRDPNKRIQGLVLYDMHTDADGIAVRNGFSDVAFGQIIQHIAKEKGDNITVILDCCNAGSGTRGSFRHNSVLNTPHLGRTRQFNHSFNTRFDEAAMRLDSLPQLSGVNKTNNFTSHVLMAGCQKNELARERLDARGAFTGALIEVLNAADLKKSTYKQVIKTLASREDFKGYEQHPRCEGKNRNRPLFAI